VVNDRWVFQVGISEHRQLYHYRRTTDTSMHLDQQKDDGAVRTPRFSLLYKINTNVSVYGIIAKGFSPPSLAEIIPPDKSYHGDLKPEYGWNYEVGIKGALWNNRLLFDASVYWFGLQDAIVSRTNTLGQQYFVNAGNTVQNGAELWLKGFLVHDPNRFVTSLALTESFSYQPYHFGTYTYPGGNNSGNKLTGVPRTIFVTGIELTTKPGWMANLSLNNTASIPLTDANDAFADSYHLLQAKIGYRHRAKHYQYELYAGGDNLLNEVYSLGNDINAAGKRFYNPSPARNYYAGLLVNIH